MRFRQTVHTPHRQAGTLQGSDQIVTDTLPEARGAVSMTLVGIGSAFGLALTTPMLRFLLLFVLVAVGFAVGYLRKHWLAVILAGSFFTRLLALAVDTQLGMTVVTGATMANHQAVGAFASGLTSGELVLSSNVRRVILGVLYAPFYLFLGDQYVVGGIATAFYGTLLGIPVYGIVRQFGDRRAALAATGAVLFWPSIFFRSLIIQRETIIVLSLFVLLYVAVRWVTRVKIAHLTVAIPALWVLFELRQENILLVAILGILVLVARGEVDAATTTLFAIGSGGVMFFALNFGSLTSFGTTVSPAAIDAFAHGRAHGSAAYLVNLHYRSWLDIVLYAPIKLGYFLFSPLPWQVSRFVDLLAGVSGWGVFLCCLLVPRAFRQYPAHRRELFVLTGYALIGATLYGIIEMNYGAAFRRRIAFVPIVLILAACVVSRVRLDGTLQTETQTTTESVVE